jgi:hypothetical protein
MRKLFMIVLAVLLLAGCGGPIDSAKQMVFQGTTKPIGELLESNSQVKTVEWQEMPVQGEGVVIAKVTFVAKAFDDGDGGRVVEIEKERQATITMKVVKNSGEIISIVSTPFGIVKEEPCADIDYFLKELENKGNLAYAFWGMPPERVRSVLVNDLGLKDLDAAN